MLTTTIAPTSGSARIAGFDVSTDPLAARRVWAALDEFGELRQPPIEDARLLLDDIAWWARALRSARAANTLA